MIWRMTARQPLFLLTVILLSTLPLSAQSATAITNALIIDGNGAPPVRNAVLVFEGDRISAVGEASRVTIPAGATVIDAAGKTVMPGLVDGHIHLIGGWDGVSVDMLGIEKYLRSLLYAGVTRVLDQGNVLYFIGQIQQEIAEGNLMGPAIHFAGPLISGPGSPWPFLSLVITDTTQVAPYLEMLVRGGVESLKLYPGLSAEVLGVLSAHAESKALPLIAHIRPGPGYGAVLRSGISASAHLPRHEIPDEDIEYMRDNQISCITTLAQYESMTTRRLNDLAFLANPLVENTTASWILQDLRTYAERVTADADSTRWTQVHTFFDGLENTTGRLRRAGVMLVAGTDAPYPGVFLGEGIHRELELLVEAGLSPLEAISTATKNPAILMKQQGDWGTLTPGALADILIIDGDPSTNISDTRRIETVIQGGQVIDRAMLVFDEKKDRGFRIRANRQ